MEYGTIEREIYIDAPPEIVFEVVSSPGHLKEWWPDDAAYDTVPGSPGEIVFGDRDADGTVVGFTVVDARPPESFSFRWTHPVGEVAAPGNSLLVTFDLAPKGQGTLLRMTETGFREMGWEIAVLEEQYREHNTGWDFYLPRLAPYVARLESSR
ncbi:SRPBCC family protein [Herbidospora cretacea]|uniref:SRPBCC family protein n=1 Tax=Herbidospora cretacea TaxID=28444 RepID=UPI0007741D1B|nr:SRPBCC family protein [Herbidospora cretacea]